MSRALEPPSPPFYAMTTKNTKRYILSIKKPFILFFISHLVYKKEGNKKLWNQSINSKQHLLSQE